MGYLTSGTCGGMIGSGGMMNWLRGTPTTTSWQSQWIKLNFSSTYLNTNYPGTTVEQTTTFYGYYMMQVLNGNGNTYGMITVNGQTGQVLLLHRLRNICAT